MSTLIVSFGHTFGDKPLFAGDHVRTEVLTFTSTSVESSAAEGDEDCVNLLADANAWVQIGVDPDADEPGTGGVDVWPLQANAEKQLTIVRGQKVSVIAR